MKLSLVTKRIEVFVELFSRPVLEQFLSLSSNAKTGIFLVRHAL